nr:unnamed protein product [Digitaria exilis]
MDIGQSVTRTFLLRCRRILLLLPCPPAVPSCPVPPAAAPLAVASVRRCRCTACSCAADCHNRAQMPLHRLRLRCWLPQPCADAVVRALPSAYALADGSGQDRESEKEENRAGQQERREDTERADGGRGHGVTGVDRIRDRGGGCACRRVGVLVLGFLLDRASIFC